MAFCSVFRIYKVVAISGAFFRYSHLWHLYGFRIGSDRHLLCKKIAAKSIGSTLGREAPISAGICERSIKITLQNATRVRVFAKIWK